MEIANKPFGNILNFKRKAYKNQDFTQHKNSFWTKKRKEEGLFSSQKVDNSMTNKWNFLREIPICRVRIWGTTFTRHSPWVVKSEDSKRTPENIQSQARVYFSVKKPETKVLKWNRIGLSRIFNCALANREIDLKLTWRRP